MPDPRPLARASVTAALVICVGCLAPKSDDLGQRSRDNVPLNGDQRNANLLSFDEIWSRIADSYFNADRLAGSGVNWIAVRDQYRPQVETAVTQRAARDAMNDALARLGETHFAILPADLYAAEGQASFQSSQSSVGLTFRLDKEGNGIVTRVDPASSAADAGVARGWILAQLDATQITPLIRHLRGALPPNRLAESQIIDHLDALVNPGVGKRVLATFLDAENQRKSATLVGRAPTGDVARLGNLPPSILRIDARVLPDGVAYFACSVFLDPPRVLGTFADLLSQHTDVSGLIIDLRGNPGGLGSMASALCGFLIDREGVRLGSMIRRDGSAPMEVNPRTPHFAGPVAVLVDGMSMSTSEIFAKGMQDLHRGRVFGEPTPGAALPSVVVKLPNGDRFQYALADYVSPSGMRLEGIGVMPDEVIPIDRAALLAGRDPTIEAATRWIQSARSTTKP